MRFSSFRPVTGAVEQAARKNMTAARRHEQRGTQFACIIRIPFFLFKFSEGRQDFNYEFLVRPGVFEFNTAHSQPMKRKPFYSHLYFWVLMGMVLGVLVGAFVPQWGI